ncbi:MAG: hypothetical protein IT285_02150 [Bdellovibrionales bacterium]|nr:hypothetical protein [Bdellovibrionales bacterium]
MILLLGFLAAPALAADLRWKEAPLALKVPGADTEWKTGPSRPSQDAEHVIHSAQGQGARAGWSAELVEFQGLPRDPAIALQQALVAAGALPAGSESWVERVAGHESPEGKADVELRFATGIAEGPTKGARRRFAARSWIFDNTNVVSLLYYRVSAPPAAREEALAALGAVSRPPQRSAPTVSTP